jgi:hypothetical protein
MLLTNWARDMGLPTERGRAGSLEQILRFCFGESYLIQMTDGRSYEDKHLDPVLDIMADEFRVHNTTMTLRGNVNVMKEGLFPKVELIAIGSSLVSDPLGDRRRLSLCVSVVKGWNNPLPPPDIEGVIAMVRHAVTMFSLTGEWDSFQKENLT